MAICGDPRLFTTAGIYRARLLKQPSTRIVELKDLLNSEATPQQHCNPLLTEKDVGHLLNLTPSCLQAWRLKGDGPPFIRISAKCIRYRPADVETWIEDNLCSSTSDFGRGGVQ
jgi:predicted DNA-binding transcriptional regulator AlpA